MKDASSKRLMVKLVACRNALVIFYILKYKFKGHELGMSLNGLQTRLISWFIYFTLKQMLYF